MTNNKTLTEIVVDDNGSWSKVSKNDEQVEIFPSKDLKALGTPRAVILDDLSDMEFILRISPPESTHYCIGPAANDYYSFQFYKLRVQ